VGLAWEVVKLPLFVALMGYVGAKALGGPTQPLSFAQPGLEEISPVIDEVELVPGANSIEVFVSGYGVLDCYDTRDTVVEVRPHSTFIVPRFKRRFAGAPCQTSARSFREKVADLNPQLDSSYVVEILGFRGIHRRQLTKTGP